MVFNSLTFFAVAEKKISKKLHFNFHKAYPAEHLFFPFVLRFYYSDFRLREPQLQSKLRLSCMKVLLDAPTNLTQRNEK